MEKIIQKAIEGGYSESIPAMGSWSLDASFWQALGKACGWTSDGKFSRFSEEMTFGEFQSRHWKTIATRFHEINLTEGWDKAVSYLEELI